MSHDLNIENPTDLSGDWALQLSLSLLAKLRRGELSLAHRPMMQHVAARGDYFVTASADPQGRPRFVVSFRPKTAPAGHSTHGSLRLV